MMTSNELNELSHQPIIKLTKLTQQQFKDGDFNKLYPTQEFDDGPETDSDDDEPIFIKVWII